MHEGDESAYNIFFGNLVRNRLLGRRSSRWEDSTLIDRREIWWKYMDCTHLTQDSE
jgi:hypothetical protein